MKKIVLTAMLVAASGPAFAQSSTAIGVGSARSSSRSDSTAVAISGQGGAGGKGGTGVGVGVANNGAISPQASVTIAGAPAQTSQTITTQGHSSVSTVPSVFAPGLAAAGIESCLGSVSGGGSWLGTGISLGGSIPDLDCSARLDSRTLWSMGLKKAAIARLCQNSRIYDSMPDVCGTYQPVARPAPVYAPAILPTTYASTEPTLRPGQIMLVEGKTGQERLCNDYDSVKQRCRLWDGQKIAAHIVHHSAPKTSVAKIAPAAPAAIAEKPAPAPAAAETKVTASTTVPESPNAPGKPAVPFSH